MRSQTRQRKPARIQFEDVLGSTLTDKRVEVLRAIQRAGSISEAARMTGVSYKAAWQAVDALSNLAGVPLIEKVVGGSGGGGAKLTAEGRQVLIAAELLSQVREEALLKLRGGRQHTGDALYSLGGIGLRTSMRNQCPVIVHEIKKLGGAVRLRLELTDGQSLYSRITTESLQLLGLKKGDSVWALFKAAAVKFMPVFPLSDPRNGLRGTISRRVGLKAGGQLILELTPGLHVVGFSEPGSYLELHEQAIALVDESAVVIGLSN
jgi:molybdate transport system regulatory protein